jgi:hypothetical protein
MGRARARVLAAVASFSIYLIPLVGPHAAWLLGEVLFRRQPGQSPRWLAANWAVALGLQLLAFGCFRWFFGKPRWLRAVPLLLAFTIVVLVLQSVLLALIPAFFLEEADVRAENISWPTVCTAAGVFQTALSTPAELWVRHSTPENPYAVLTMPACQLTDVPLPQPRFQPGAGVDFMIDPTSVIPGGRAVVRKTETRGRTSWFVATGALLSPLDTPAGDTGATQPLLSQDGVWTGWLEPVPGSGPPLLYRVVLRARDRERIVDLSGLGPATYVLEGLDVKSEEVMLWRTDRLVAAGFDGRLKKEYAVPSAARPQPSTYRHAGNYWLAWDAYRDAEPYRLEWSLPFGAGSHRVPLGRTIHAAAFDPSGRWIAVSVGTSLNIGKARDAVYILSSVDGHEVFRKYLPPFTRSPVAFLDGGFFAYSELDGVHLLRVP